ncbi:MAG: hypothetical protein ACI9IA_000047 [Enterobacterales bacterium]|jgi:hypothetical protein
MKYLKFIFPFAYSLNMFSMTLIIIFFGLFGQPEMAADAAIIHAATLVAFMAFSGNARNIILSQDKTLTVNQLLRFRLVLVLPLSCLAYFLCYGVLRPEAFLVNALIIRRALEWFVELQISERELCDDIAYAKKYSLIQGTLITVLSALIFFDEMYFLQIVLSIWAFSPVLFLYKFIKGNFHIHGNGLDVWKRILPHLGSSWIIACSAYIFRLLIILLAGKAIAGVLFSAYAIGGMMNSIYTYSVGPSMARLLKDGKVKKEKIYTFLVIALLAFLGILFVAYAFWIERVSIAQADAYYLPIGLSFIGGAIMIVAQRQRIHILQLEKNSVFVPDVIVNILIISSVPFSFYLLGVDSLTGLFLWNAILTFLFYKIPSINADWIRGKFSVSWSRKILIVFDRDVIQAIILFFLLMPIFFQLDGSLLFHSNQLVFDHGGSFSKLPLPYSMLACFLGLVLIKYNDKSGLEASVLFAFFSLMMFSVYVTSFNNQSELLSKIIFLIQFILPVFALMLGRAYISPRHIMLTYQSVFLLVLALIIPLQVLITALYGFGILESNMSFFSIYQHLQYVPTVLVGVYAVIVLSYKDEPIFRSVALILLPIVWVYAVFSGSVVTLFLIFLVSVFLFFSFSDFKKYNDLYKFFAALIFCTGVLIFKDSVLNFFAHGGSEEAYIFKKMVLDENGLFRNVNERLDIWRVVLGGVFESDKTFWFGHSERMSKDVANSAHNYYFDLVYHFGFIAMLPLLSLIAYTVYKFISLFVRGHLPVDIVGLSLFVFFLLLIDNSLKVGLRQPYSGIVSFFLWGLLLSKLNEKSYSRD